MRSLYLNLEIVLRSDAALAERLRAYFEHHLPPAAEISPKSTAARDLSHLRCGRAVLLAVAITGRRGQFRLSRTRPGTPLDEALNR